MAKEQQQKPEPKDEPKLEAKAEAPSSSEQALLATGAWKKTGKTYTLLHSFSTGPEQYLAGLHRPLDEALAIESLRPK